MEGGAAAEFKSEWLDGEACEQEEAAGGGWEGVGSLGLLGTQSQLGPEGVDDESWSDSSSGIFLGWNVEPDSSVDGSHVSTSPVPAPEFGHFSTEDAVPLPVSGETGARGPKRQRRTAALDSVGLAGAAVATVQDPESRSIDPQTVTFAIVHGWLTDPAVRCAGPRPHCMSAYTNAQGLVFKEPSSDKRRAKGSDTWTSKGGPKGNSIEHVTSDAWIKRSYGQVSVRGRGGAAGRKLRYHQYTLHATDSGSGAATRHPVATSCKVFHIVNDYGPRKSKQPREQQVQVEPREQQVQVDGLLRVKKTSERERRWMSFDDQTGREMGGIEISLDGDAIKLVSRSGDFAEWYPRLPSEPEFEEGDVVALCPAPPGSSYDRSHLTRDTGSARQLGVISRRAIVEGSMPDSKYPRSDFDTIAYCGRVPVKVIGSVRAGDLLAPSGGNDGTAVAVAGFSAIKVGRAETDKQDPCGDMCSSNNSERGMELELKHPQQLRYHMVDANVFAPSETVTDQRLQLMYGLRLRKIALVVVVLLAITLVWLLASQYATTQPAAYGCIPIVLADGTVSGKCDGAPGSVCTYESCVSGYALVPRQVASHDTPMSAQRCDLKQMSIAHGASHSSTQALKFLPCTGCFGTDGLMCQFPNRTFPMTEPKRPAHPAPVHYHGSVKENYRYDCPSDIHSLAECEVHGGTVCYGAYNGVRPCETCQTAGKIEGGYRPAGLACEATAQGLPWKLRDDDAPHSRCVSDPGANPDLIFNRDYIPLNECAEIPRPIFLWPDDVMRVLSTCLPVGRQYNDGDSSSVATLRTSVQHIVKSAGENEQQLFCSSTKQPEPTAPMPVLRTDSAKNTQESRSRSCDGSGGRSSSRSASKTTTVGSHQYSGTEMHCVRSHCPAETLGMLQLGKCQRCGGKEAVVRIPRTPVPIGDKAVSVVAVACPDGYTGSVNRTCTSSGWVEDSPVVGGCVRKSCPATVFTLEGWASTMSLELRRQHEVVVGETMEGSGRVVLRCPDSYRGELSVVCDAGADAWGSRRNCTLKRHT
jgi:hypothetical protein